MDTPPLFIIPDQCEALGLLNTDPLSMTAEWGLTNDECEMWQLELNAALETIASSPESGVVDSSDAQTNEHSNRETDSDIHKIFALPVPLPHRRSTGLGACTKTIKMTDTPSSIRESRSHTEINVLPLPEHARLTQDMDVGASAGNIGLEASSHYDQTIDTYFKTDTKTEQETVTSKDCVRIETPEQKYIPSGMNLEAVGVGQGPEKMPVLTPIATHVLADSENILEMEPLIQPDDDWWAELSDILGRPGDSQPSNIGNVTDAQTHAHPTDVHDTNIWRDYREDSDNQQPEIKKRCIYVGRWPECDTPVEEQRWKDTLNDIDMEMTGAAPVTPPRSPPRHGLVERGNLIRPPRRPDEPFLVERVARTPFSRRLIRQYNHRRAQEIAYRVDLADRNLLGLDIVRDERTLHDLWSSLLTHMRRDENVGDEDLVRLHFNHPSLTSGDIKVNLQRFADLTPETINRRLSEVAQSKEGLALDDDLQIMMGVIQFPRGGGRLTADNVSKSRRAGYVQPDEPNHCLAVSLCICRERKKNGPRYH